MFMPPVNAVFPSTTSDLRWLVKRGYLSHARETTAPQDPDRHFDPPEPNLAFARNTCFVLTEAGLAAVDRRCQPDRAVAAMPDSAGHDHAGPVTDAGPRADMGPAKDSQIDLPSRELAARQGRPPAIPNWDRDTRTFLVGAELVKRFRVPSPNQEAVLDAFQEEGWPPSIDDPLSPVPDQQPKRRLHDTIRSLNLNQAKRLIRFRGDGTGQRVFWELL